MENLAPEILAAIGGVAGLVALAWKIVDVIVGMTPTKIDDKIWKAINDHKAGGQ